MLCFGQPSATKLRSMPRLPRGSSDSSARARSLGRRKEHEGREVLQDIVEPVLGPRWNEHNAPGTHLAILSSHSNSCAAADDVVDLILGMGRLLVLAAPGSSYRPQLIDATRRNSRYASPRRRRASRRS